MKDLKVAVLGPTPNHMGYYHAREFERAGADVVAILRSSQEGAYSSEKSLEEFGIKAKPYWNLEKLLDETKPDAVSVCTAAEKHYEHARLAIQAGAHVLCEKPICWSNSKTPEENLSMAGELFALAAQKRIIFTANTQLVYLLDKSHQVNGEDNGKGFQFKLETAGKGSGLEIPADLLPHPLSFLLRLKIDDFEKIEGEYSDKETILKLNYANGRSPTEIKLAKPGFKSLVFGFGDYLITKEENKYPTKSGMSYSLFNKKTNKRIVVDDPLSVSVSRFVEAVRDANPGILLVSPDEAFANMQLQSTIMEYLLKQHEYSDLKCQNPQSKTSPKS